MVLGEPQFGRRLLQRRLRRHPLRFEPCDLGIGGDRIGLAGGDVGCRGGELRPGPRHARVGRGDGLAEGGDFLSREGERGAGPLEGNLVRPRVDDKEELPLPDLLIVTDRKVDDVPVHLGSNADEVRAHGGVVGLGAALPVPHGDRHRDRGTHQDERPDHAPQPATPPGGRLLRIVHGLSHETRSARPQG